MTIYFGARFNASEFDVQAMIDEISTEELVAYLNESELETDEIIALIDLEELDIDGMINEDISLLDDLELDAVLEEYPEFETDFND
jgi:type II secretory pathway component PulM